MKIIRRYLDFSGKMIAIALTILLSSAAAQNIHAYESQVIQQQGNVQQIDKINTEPISSSSELSQERMKELKEEYGLEEEPLPSSNIFEGDIGFSLTDEPVIIMMFPLLEFFLKMYVFVSLV